MPTSLLKHLNLTLLGAIAGAISLNVVTTSTPLAQLAIAQTEAKTEATGDRTTTDEPTTEAPNLERPILTMGMKNGAVKDLKRRLKQLGHYQGSVTSVYDEATQDAVIKFQTEHSLEPTGEFDLAAFEILERQEQKLLKKAQEKAKQESQRQRKLLLVGFGGTVGLIGLAGGVILLFRFVNSKGRRDVADSSLQDAGHTESYHHADGTPSTSLSLPLADNSVYPSGSSSKFEQPTTDEERRSLHSPASLNGHHRLGKTTTTASDPSGNGQLVIQHTDPFSTPTTSSLVVDEWAENSATPSNENGQSSHAPEVSHTSAHEVTTVPTLTATPTYRNGHEPGMLVASAHPELAPLLDRVELLIRDLQSLDAETRRQAIWELAQDSDSRAVQPLVNLLLDSDSQQQGLILEALSQIGIRTLKPINRALALSIQDDNAQVRKNAIRDVTHIYSLVSQLSHLVSYATDDPDPDVQVTAKWALEQIKQIRTTDQSES